MRMKRWSPAACAWLLMLVFVAVDSTYAAYVNSADAEAIGDNDNQMYSQADAMGVGAPSLGSERRYEYKKVVMRALADLAEQIRNRHLTSKDQPDVYDELGLNLREAKKRGRWQGFCFRRTRSGRILPYICWKGSNF